MRGRDRERGTESKREGERTRERDKRREGGWEQERERREGETKGSVHCGDYKTKV